LVETKYLAERTESPFAVPASEDTAVESLIPAKRTEQPWGLDPAHRLAAGATFYLTARAGKGVLTKRTDHMWTRPKIAVTLK
jgi:hypothetical protein